MMEELDPEEIWDMLIPAYSRKINTKNEKSIEKISRDKLTEKQKILRKPLTLSYALWYIIK